MENVIRFNITHAFVNDIVILPSCKMNYINNHYYHLFDILRDGFEDLTVKSVTHDNFLKECANISIVVAIFSISSKMPLYQISCA